MQVILGQPWQRAYNGVPNRRREGINFEYDQAILFTPFLSEEDFALDLDSNKDEAEEEDDRKGEKTADSTKEVEQTSHHKDPRKENNHNLVSKQPKPK